MFYLHRHLVLNAALAAAFSVLIAATGRPAQADENTATNPGFGPATGQINPGFDQKHPSLSEPRKIPTPAEARAAKMMPSSDHVSVGDGPAAGNSGGGASATTGSGASQPNATSGPQEPIGATGQTMPAKFSKRNDILDRVPIMAQPMALSEQQRQQIYQAVMADKTVAATDADALAPASQLTTDQALNETHSLPESLGGIANIKALTYLKAKNKVLLVEPATRVVVEQFDS